VLITILSEPFGKLMLVLIGIGLIGVVGADARIDTATARPYTAVMA
jgi:hypothetical protein